MKLFGWKSAGRDVRPVLARYGLWSGGGSPGEWSDDYAAQVRQGYCRNAVAQRAVRLVAQGLAGAPLAASSPELLALVTARSGGQALTETVAAHLLLHGNAYVQIMTDPAGAVVELFALRPERVSVEADAGGWPVAYRYRVGERVTRLMADGARPEVVHLRGFHPLDDHYGLGCLGAAAGAIALHNAAARWNKALLDNAARPSGALVHDPGDGSVLSREQFERLRTEMEAGFAGAGNAGRPMLLEGGLKWQALSLTPADMDFVGLKAAAAREIACSFGVPPMLLGLPGDATYANYREASRALWRLAILPLADTIFSGLAQGLAGWFEAPWLRVNVDKVTALAEDRERLWAQVNAAGFLSDEEKRAMLGLSAEHAGGVA
ncbi:phage portal protein [Sphingomonas sp. H39-1-10]|uniref:phage portal protein n=1 Tax=Sphingomonas pollutisoli TaxID=3030829 RepID=UPI0023B8F640|nr:phage portal protein [Sphingomonas pollutisoli]MDF0486792.1 phage portal protein [Sphingomonas pollutisoli]